MEEKPNETTQRYRLGDFEGPLDLLLFLIKKAEVNIYDIPIAHITEQYLQFLNGAERVELESLTEFYLMATTLLYIKSRMLLPVEVNLEEEVEDPRRELIEKLIEYQKFKKLSDAMAQKELEHEWVLERKDRQRILPFTEDDNLWEQVQVWDLLKTFTALVSNISSERVMNLFEEVSINEKMSLIDELLELRKEFMFTDLITRSGSLMEVVCSFLAVLESVKLRKIIIMQNRLFGDIRISLNINGAREG